MYAVTLVEFTAEGTANILIIRYIPLWGRPRSILSDNGLQFCSKLSLAVYQLLGVRKIVTTSYHPRGNGGVKCVNQTMTQMLAMTVNELPNHWDEQLPHAEFAHSSSVSAATGLAPNEVHMGRLPRLPLTIFERGGVAGHQRSPRLLRLGDGPPAARVRYRSRAPRPHYCPREPPQLHPLRRFASGPQIRRWRLGVGVHYGGYHPPGRKSRHGRQGPQG